MTPRFVAAVLGAGCAAGSPVAVVDLGAAALGPVASLEALEAAVAGGAAAVRLPVALSADRVPLLIDGPRLDIARCETVFGAALTEDSAPWVLLLDAAELQASYRCDGLPPATLDAALDALAGGPGVGVAIEARYLPNVSHDPEVFAAEILARWPAAAPPGPLWLVGDLDVTVGALEARAAALGADAALVRRWPRVPPEGSAVAARAGQAVLEGWGLLDPVDAALGAGADVLWLSPDAAAAGSVARAEAAGLGVWVGPVARPAAARAAALPGVGALVLPDPAVLP